MARLLHDGGHHHDGGDRGVTGAEEMNRHRRRQHRLIPVGEVMVDTTPVTFRTPGQAMNVVSNPVTQTVMVPVTQTQTIQVPTSFGCFVCVPVTQTVQVPVTTTVNLPVATTPVPRVICPPNSAFCQAVNSCQSGGQTSCMG